MKKCIITPNGAEVVDLSPQEEATRLAEENIFRNPPPPPPPRLENIASAIENAPDWATARTIMASWMRML